MNKILVIKHDGSMNVSFDSLKKVAKNIADTWDETGIVAIPAHFNYEFVDCDKFMGVMIDRHLAANESFDGVRMPRYMVEIIKGNYVQYDNGIVVPGPYKEEKVK